MRQSEIWLVSLEPTIGAEIKKTRPAIIVNDNTLGRLPLKIVVPITDWKDRYTIASWMIRLVPDRQNNLSKESAADCFQIRSIAEERCIRKLGEVSNELLAEIQKALALVLNIKQL